jgi:release factor glutamine methyltransferase
LQFQRKYVTLHKKVEMNYETLWRRLTDRYEAGEAKAIVRLVMEVRFGLTLTDILCGKVEALPAHSGQELERIMQRLAEGEPVQYVLGKADFCGRTFCVAPGVLIPRPETAELCEDIITDIKDKITEKQTFTILDVGTGSGCIACTLAAEIPGTQVTAWDISDTALRIAADNARRLGVNVTFEKVDVLSLSPNTQHPTPNTQHPIPNTQQWDLIVSNPPYICNKERATMEAHVLDYEPESALFVPDSDPLLFYRAIARYAAKTLKPDGSLWFEINPLYADELVTMLNAEGFENTEIRNDQFGKQRFTASGLKKETII